MKDEKKGKDRSEIEINAKIDLDETHEILAILEDMDDEALALKLLKDFNDASKELSNAIIEAGAIDQNDEWKKKLESKKGNLIKIINRIKKINAQN